MGCFQLIHGISRQSSRAPTHGEDGREAIVGTVYHPGTAQNSEKMSAWRLPQPHSVACFVDVLTSCSLCPSGWGPQDDYFWDRRASFPISPLSQPPPFSLEERGCTTGDLTCTMERPEQSKVDVCNAVYLTFDLSYLSVPSHLISGEGKGNWSSQNGYQLLEVNWESWN